MTEPTTNNRLINANPVEQKVIETLISTFIMLMSKEKNLGLNMISMTLAIIEEDEFQKAMKAFDDNNPLHAKAKELLDQLRNLNRKPINTALSAFIISRVKINLANNQNKGDSKETAYNLHHTKIGF